MLAIFFMCLQSDVADARDDSPKLHPSVLAWILERASGNQLGMVLMSSRSSGASRWYLFVRLQTGLRLRTTMRGPEEAGSAPRRYYKMLISLCVKGTFATLTIYAFAFAVTIINSSTVSVSSSSRYRGPPPSVLSSYTATNFYITMPSDGKRTQLVSNRATHSYPRKRALAACNTCRVRKIKCNNAKPICSSCETSGAQCIYENHGDLSK